MYSGTLSSAADRRPENFYMKLALMLTGFTGFHYDTLPSAIWRRARQGFQSSSRNTLFHLLHLIFSYNLDDMKRKRALLRLRAILIGLFI